MTDFLLIFPPQWSPFQPPLAPPSLSAWLKREGFDVSSQDVNILFFEWLLSDECAEILINRARKLPLRQSQKDGYEAILKNAGDFRRDIFSLRDLKKSKISLNHEDLIKKYYIATKALEVYLEVISKISDAFALYPYDFRLKGGNLNFNTLEQMLLNPPEVFSIYAEQIIEKNIMPANPKVIGFSCLGQEQLYFVLLFGQLLKSRSDIPIIVGGTFLTRIFEQGSLKSSWFSKYFDIIAINEGEKPCQEILSNLRDGFALTKEVSGIIFLEDNTIVSSPPGKALNPAEIPIPDFDDMPLDRYFSIATTLPLLASRGCYWGKCEFCRHGMVYGDNNFKVYEINKVLDTVNHLSQKYDISQFSFRDEAIPPSIIRQLGKVFPPHVETGWTFSGDVRFDKSFTKDDFTNLYKIGFRSLQVGLESGSEHVLKLMKKGDDNYRKETMIRNLSDATESGIWIHCFLFFGFPGETDEDAEQTYEFVLQHANTIGNFGCGTFILEHNSPIFHHRNDFGVQIMNQSDSTRMNVFYEHEVSEGISIKRALEWMETLVLASNKISKFHAVSWIPREQYICILSKIEPRQLIEEGQSLRTFKNLPPNASLSEIASLISHPREKNTVILINRINHRILNLKGKSSELIRLFYENNSELLKMHEYCPNCIDWL